jgi:hypothetical protein
MASFEVRADVVGNRIYVKTTGFFGDDEIEEQVKKVAAETAKLRPGFVVIADITDMKATTPAGARALQGLMQEYKRRGISRIVRIVGQEVLAKMQLQRITQEIGIPISYVTTQADADALLRNAAP